MTRHKIPKPSHDQLSIEIGAQVTVRKDDGSLVKTIAESKPWLLGGHTWVIKAQGISGGYALHRVTPGWTP